MELWDIYDRNRQPKGYTHVRGEKMKPGDYHEIVNVWIRNSRDEYFLTKRTQNKMWGGYWECTGGSVVSGDTSRQCAVKEVFEEAGIELNPDEGILIHTYCREKLHGQQDFCDVWFFEKDFDLSDVVLQEGETCDAMWATREKIMEMLEKGHFVPMIDYIDLVFNFAK